MCRDLWFLGCFHRINFNFICFLCSFDLFLYVGGYWSKNDGFYHGGETHEVGLMSAGTFGVSTVVMLVVDHLGYTENMRKVSWYPPESPENREDIDSEEVLKKVVHFAIGAGALTLFVVREDDPYLGRRVDSNLGYLADEDNDCELAIAEEGVNLEDDNEEQNGDSNSESDGGRKTVDESKYPKFRIGDEYNTIQSFKNVVNKYAVKKRRDIKYEKSDSKRVVAICSEKKCPWRISASINSSSNRVGIRALNDEHNCTWQGKVSLLTNARIEVREKNFHRFYCCFAALKDGWKAACRKIIHLDGTFLKWRMSGMLLVACGRDPNDQMFPIAWGIVDCENGPNWMWFLEHLMHDLDLGAGNGLTLGSDQQKGLIAAVKDVLPFAEHRML